MGLQDLQPQPPLASMTSQKTSMMSQAFIPGTEHHQLEAIYINPVRFINFYLHVPDQCPPTPRDPSARFPTAHFLGTSRSWHCGCLSHRGFSDAPSEQWGPPWVVLKPRSKMELATSDTGPLSYPPPSSPVPTQACLDPPHLQSFWRAGYKQGGRYHRGQRPGREGPLGL